MSEEPTIEQHMRECIPHAKKTMEDYRDGLDAELQEQVTIDMKEVLRALAQEKISSRKAAYSAALTARKAYKVYLDAEAIKAAQGDCDAAMELVRGMTREKWILGALGYELKEFLEGKLKQPRMVRLPS